MIDTQSAPGWVGRGGTDVTIPPQTQTMESARYFVTDNMTDHTV